MDDDHVLIKNEQIDPTLTQVGSDGPIRRPLWFGRKFGREDVLAIKLFRNLKDPSILQQEFKSQLKGLPTAVSVQGIKGNSYNKK